MGESSRLQSPARWAALAALLCGIHCVATPFLVAALPFLAISKAAEWWAFGLTIALGGGVTLLGPGRSHRGIMALLVVGISIWFGALMEFFEPLPEAVPAGIGSVTFAVGMLWSARLCRSEECEICEVEEPA